MEELEEGGLVLESMAAGATALLTWFGSSRLITPLLVRSRLCSTDARQGTFNPETVRIYVQRSGPIYLRVLLLLLLLSFAGAGALGQLRVQPELKLPV